jgi:hypothetical protein
MTPIDALKLAIETCEQRTAVYAGEMPFEENMMRIGNAIFAKFGENGARFESRKAIMTQLEMKMIRYYQNIRKGGHLDSTLDIMVYAAMLYAFDCNELASHAEIVDEYDAPKRRGHKLKDARLRKQE